MGVVFFPSIPFMGVTLFPSFRLRNASGEGCASLALLSLFFILLLPPLFFISSSLFSLSSSLFSLLLLLLFHLLFFFSFFFFTASSSSSLPSAQNLSIPFSSSPAFHLLFHICFSFSSFLSFSPFPFLPSKLFCPPFFPLFFFFCYIFLREHLVLIIIDDITDCNRM